MVMMRFSSSSRIVAFAFFALAASSSSFVQGSKSQQYRISTRTGGSGGGRRRKRRQQQQQQSRAAVRDDAGLLFDFEILDVLSSSTENEHGRRTASSTTATATTIRWSEFRPLVRSTRRDDDDELPIKILPWGVVLRGSGAAAAGVVGGDFSSGRESEDQRRRQRSLSVVEVVAAKDMKQGGGGDEDDNVNKHDSPSQDCGDDDEQSTAIGPAATKTSGNDDDNDDDDGSPVGVKSHSNKKKSNAVGDPDGGDSDDDSDSDEDTDLEEEWKELQAELLPLVDPAVPSEVQVELELVEQEDDQIETPPVTCKSGEDDDDKVSTSSHRRPRGGVGIRFGGGGNKRNNNRREKREKEEDQLEAILEEEKQANADKALAKAWLRHVYLPPSPAARDFLQQNARAMDGASKTRLDRRTLYGGLLLEWSNSLAASSSSSSESSTASSRKFLQPATSQSLQAALSLATQPQWRRAAAAASTSEWTSGIRFYAEEQDEMMMIFREGAPTLAMQESIAMALAHSLGAGMVILDDEVLLSLQQELQRSKDDDDEEEPRKVKPAVLIQSLLELAKSGKLRGSASTTAQAASISSCMKRELAVETFLEDPFDERAAASCQDMAEWEKTWLGSGENATAQGENVTASEQQAVEPSEEESGEKPISLVLFIRTDSSERLLQSKSAIETLLKECSSPDSTHLLVLGKGVNADTTTLPPQQQQDHQQQPHQHQDPSVSMMSSSSSESPFESMMRNNPLTPPGVANPWTGGGPNPNASGQNDPQGSRRFNIFLARTMNPETGTAGILGAIAPPQLGNLFPQIMAMQAAKERSQKREDGDDEDEDHPFRAEMERLAHMMHEQMERSGGNMPAPQFFNATLAVRMNRDGDEGGEPQVPPPEVMQQTLQQAMSELLDRLAMMNDHQQDQEDDESSSALHKAFAQVLRNDNLRRGIAENLARAAPALSDPKCQGVMLSVYVPPPPTGSNKAPSPSPQQQQQQQQGNNNMAGWFQKILHNQDQQPSKSNNDDEDGSKPQEEGDKKKKLQQTRARVATAAAAAALGAKAKEEKEDAEDDSKLRRSLARLESVCRPIVVSTPSDPVRAKSWQAWIARERGAVVFRHNRIALQEALQARNLALQTKSGTQGAGSALRQMLSVRDISSDLPAVLQCAIELEANKAQQERAFSSCNPDEQQQQVDVTLSQLVWTPSSEDAEEPPKLVLTTSATNENMTLEKPDAKQFIHPSSLESALSAVCRLSPSPAGAVGSSSASAPAASHRTREEIAALAQDKHERALLSQVVSPHEIGVTYDMIGGLSQVKELLRQSITYPLKYPHLYSEGIAREAVKGVLLFGPPGTGKTMLAKAVATEGGASFLSVDASSVENKWLGESEKNAKAVFTLARRLAPCVIFIDEVDSLLSSREGSSDDSAHGTLTSVKTTMMSEWDGLNSGTTNAGGLDNRVIVIGSTNRPFDLDEAVLRRFPRRILVDLPDLETRTEILQVTLAENRLDASVNLTEIAQRLEGYTGSDLKEICREAVVQISHEQAKYLDQGILSSSNNSTTSSSLSCYQRLRPVTNEDFDQALAKLKRSVSETGKELARVWEWNDEYGEIKQTNRKHLGQGQLANMYL